MADCETKCTVKYDLWGENNIGFPWIYVNTEERFGTIPSNGGVSQMARTNGLVQKG